MIKYITLLIITIVVNYMSNSLFAQTIDYEVTGQVLNKQAKPLPFSSIKLKGQKTGIYTDHNGHFSIEINQLPDTLIISNIGYQKALIPVNKSKSELMITLLLDSSHLTDVTINTGYQKLSPNKVNGSYVVIDNKTINQQSGLNILQRLKGVTSGLLFTTGKSNPNPNNNTGITIRGLSTINGPLDPLIVIDNFIYDGDINNINPNDVKNITILKDAAAASIWGARAGNGVIVITTKKSQYSQKMQLDLNANTTMTSKPDLYSIPQISNENYINLEQYLFRKGYYDADINSPNRPALTPAVEIFLARKNRTITASDSAQQIRDLIKINNRDQYNKYFSKTGITQQYSISLHGGSKQLAWLFSGNYDKDITNSEAKYHKINLHFENSIRPIKNLNINFGIYYSNSQTTLGKPDYASTTTINYTRQVPYLSLVSQKGESIAIPHNYRSGYIDTAGSGRLLDWHYYPMTEWRHNRQTKNIDDLTAHIGLNYKLLHNIKLKLNYQYERQRVKNSRYNDTASFYTKDKINLFSQIDPKTGIVKRIVPLGGMLNETNSQLYSQNLRIQATYNKSWSHNHNLNILVGLEARETGSNSNTNNYYGYYKDPLQYTNVDVTSRYPTYITGNMSQLSGYNGLTETNHRYASFFSNASYTFKDKYTVSGSMRRDGSNIFGATTNDKWKPLWSAGIGWEISKEAFYNNNWLSFLKITATMGSSGNVDLRKTPLPVAGGGVNPITSLPFLRINTINNPGLKWEQAFQTNLRVSFAALKHRISGSIEYYQKKGTDLYGDAPYDYTAWGLTPTITRNVASMKGKGIDININTNNINGNFKWNSKFLINLNSSKTTKYYTTSSEPLARAIHGGKRINPIVGKPLYAIVAYKWGGLDKLGNPQGYIGNKKSIDYMAIRKNAYDNGLNGNSIKYIGSASPKLYGSIINSFTYKEFELCININFKSGYYLFKPALSYVRLTQYGDGGTDYENRWQIPGDENKTNIPSFIYPTNSRRNELFQSSEINVIKGDHLRLQYINLTYTYLRQKEKSPFNRMQFYVNVENLGIIWRANKEGIDPDNPQSIPAPKTVTFGLRINL